MFVPTSHVCVSCMVSHEKQHELCCRLVWGMDMAGTRTQDRAHREIEAVKKAHGQGVGCMQSCAENTPVAEHRHNAVTGGHNAILNSLCDAGAWLCGHMVQLISHLHPPTHHVQTIPTG
jgi:hypothetical protein